jgi:hypothetical protein
MGGLLLAKAFLPTSSHIKQALAYLDFAVKLEIVLVSFCDSILFRVNYQAHCFGFLFGKLLCLH